jgi:hypothetical protein
MNSQKKRQHENFKPRFSFKKKSNMNVNVFIFANQNLIEDLHFRTQSQHFMQLESTLFFFSSHFSYM